MENIEILTRARLYIDSLAKGINPLDGKEMQDGELLNNVRLSRCFFYVSEVLGEVIANGGVVGSKKKAAAGSKAGLSEFALSDEQKTRVVISKTPIPISYFTEAINAVIDLTEYKKIGYAAIQNYLIEEGYLGVETDLIGNSCKFPTEKGLAIGIISEKRQYNGKDRNVNLYDERAQRFILDNINDM
ncbi:MAG: hypothetical protein LBQ40_02325 [Clostridiales bacterium]|jgi:hypothetical protein|nr:hypothetical protein [Clostridiales bacterium]